MWLSAGLAGKLEARIIWRLTHLLTHLRTSAGAIGQRTHMRPLQVADWLPHAWWPSSRDNCPKVDMHGIFMTQARKRYTIIPATINWSRQSQKSTQFQEVDTEKSGSKWVPQIYYKSRWDGTYWDVQFRKVQSATWLTSHGVMHINLHTNFFYLLFGCCFKSCKGQVFFFLTTATYLHAE